MRTKFIFIFLLVIGFTFIDSSLLAQCPMCKMSAESNLANGGTEGKGLNAGILYLLSLPYLAVGVLAYVWFKKRKAEH
jgi:hypothetical protein